MTEPQILYGGQAVIEGVMMRGRNFVTCAVRRGNGAIVIKGEPIPRGVYSGVWARTPFLRALPLLWDTLVLGTRMLTWAANVQASDELEKSPPAEGSAGAPTPTAPASAYAGAGSSPASDPTAPFPTPVAVEPTPVPASSPAAEPEALSRAALYGTLALSLGLGLAVFFALPVFIANFLGGFGVTPFWNNVIEGVIRLALFLAYLWAIGRIPDIQRVFMYHGAEHKTIAAYEGGAELVPSQVQQFSKEHPRCGTGFLLTVVVVSIIFFIVLGDLPLGVRLASRIVLIPFVAAVSYELIRFAAKHRSFFLFDWLVVRPSLALQSFTTRQPTDDMVEVAIASFQDVRRREQALASS